jgi:bleomycin hydrolase
MKGIKPMKTAALLVTLLALVISTAGAETPGQLSDKLVTQIEASFDATGDHTAEINAITNNDINSLSLNRKELIEHTKLFNFKLKAAGITNQRGSGRCWLFAGLNVISPSVMNKLKLSEFEFSQPYLTFWDKMEKANLFLEEIIDTRNLPIDDRKLVTILSSPFGDGGWWHYVTALMKKYGAVPLSAMPETKQSVNTGSINNLAETKLKAFASELRTMSKSGKSVDELRKRKDAMLGDVYKLLVFSYGRPPKEFTFRYESKDSTISGERTFTPQSFYQEFVASQLPSYVMLMDDPNKEYGKTYQIELSRNMLEESDATMLNLPIARIKEYARKMLLDSQAVWFGCDVGKEHLGDSAILETGIYEPERLFGMDFKLTKAELINYRASTPNHAMVLLGVDTAKDGKSIKWLVENSWGSSRGDKGYWYMYDGWFDKYVYVGIVEKKYLLPEDSASFEKKPVTLPVWDPFYQALKAF